MATMNSQLVAIMVATIAVILGSTVGGNTAEATLELSSLVAVVGVSVCLCKFIARELVDLRNRFGAAVLWGVLEMS